LNARHYKEQLKKFFLHVYALEYSTDIR